MCIRDSCKASTPGAAVIDGSDPPAVAAYAITHSRNATNYDAIIAAIAPDEREAFVQAMTRIADPMSC